MVKEDERQSGGQIKRGKEVKELQSDGGRKKERGRREDERERKNYRSNIKRLP